MSVNSRSPKTAGEAAVPEPFELSKDDPAVYEMIARADTTGMFQLESSGQRNLNTRLKASEFEDIVAAISLFRPGPLEAEMITPFIRRRHGLEEISVIGEDGRVTNAAPERFRNEGRRIHGRNGSAIEPCESFASVHEPRSLSKVLRGSKILPGRIRRRRETQHGTYTGW